MNIIKTDLENVKKIGVYCITNLINGKKYVGKTGNKKGFIFRWNEHKNDFKNKRHSNFVIYRAFNKYGIDNFEFSILEIVERIDDKNKLNQILNEREQYWIEYYDTYNNGYNMTKGGEGMLGFYLSDDIKEKISNTKKNKGLAKGKNNPMYNIHRFGKNSPHYNHKHSEKTKKYLSEIRKNKELSVGKNNPNWKGYNIAIDVNNLTMFILPSCLKDLPDGWNRKSIENINNNKIITTNGYTIILISKFIDFDLYNIDFIFYKLKEEILLNFYVTNYIKRSKIYLDKAIKIKSHCNNILKQFLKF